MPSKKSGHPVKIAIDFDGVIGQYRNGWQGVAPTEPPQEGAVEFVRWLLDRGYEVFVFTTRARYDGGMQAIREWMRSYLFPDIPITGEKHPADLYIDDRALRFNGNFNEVYDYLIANPVPSRWEKQPG